MVVGVSRRISTVGHGNVRVRAHNDTVILFGYDEGHTHDETRGRPREPRQSSSFVGSLFDELVDRA